MRTIWRYLTKRDTSTGGMWIGALGFTLLGTGHVRAGGIAIIAGWAFDVFTKPSTHEGER